MRGRLGGGRSGGLQSRTVPSTPSVVPFDLVAAGDTALELKNKPLDSELENVIEDPLTLALPRTPRTRTPTL